MHAGETEIIFFFLLLIVLRTYYYDMHVIISPLLRVRHPAMRHFGRRKMVRGPSMWESPNGEEGDRGKNEINLSYTHCRLLPPPPLFRHLINESKTRCTVHTMHERIKRISKFVDASVDLSLSHSAHGRRCCLPEWVWTSCWPFRFRPVPCDFMFFLWKKRCARHGRCVPAVSWFVSNFNSLFLAWRFPSREDVRINTRSGNKKKQKDRLKSMTVKTCKTNSN